MSTIDRDHPAVEAALDAEDRTDGPMCRDTAQYMLDAAVEHLTADDLRNTHAGQALMAEAWEEGAQAVRLEEDHEWGFHGLTTDPGECETCGNLDNPYKDKA